MTPSAAGKLPKRPGKARLTRCFDTDHPKGWGWVRADARATGSGGSSVEGYEAVVGGLTGVILRS